MTRRLATALLALLAFAALPVAADSDADFGSLWSLPCGGAGEHREAEQANRIANMMAASPVVRIGIQVRPGATGFDPDDSNVLQEWCWTNGELIAAADEAGAQLAIVFLVHTQGAPNGWNYHEARKEVAGYPVLDKNAVRAVSEGFVQYLEANHPSFKILGANGKGVKYVSIGNEFGYCPRCPSDFVDRYWKVFDFVEPTWPNAWIKLDGGLSRRANVSRADLDSRGLTSVYHCNHESDAECRSKLEEMVDQFGSVFVDEDVPPEGQGSRWGVCASTPGCRGYFTMYVRHSGNPPETTCCWKVGGCNSNDARAHVGVESCEGIMNSVPGQFGPMQRFFRGARRLVGLGPPVGTFPNYEAFNADAISAGTAAPGWDFYVLPHTIEDDGGPPPPPSGECNPMGMHQWCGGFMWYHRNVLDQTGIPNPAACKADEDLQRMYCGWLRHTGQSYQCPASCPGA